MFRTLTSKAVIASIAGLVLIGLATTLAIQSVLSLRYSSQSLAGTTMGQISLVKRFSNNITRAIGEGRAFSYGGDEGELLEAQEALEAAAITFVALDPNAVQEYQGRLNQDSTAVVFYQRGRELFGQLQQRIESLEDASPSEREEVAEELEDLEEEFALLEQEVDRSLEEDSVEFAAESSQQLNLIIASIGGILAVCVLFIGGALVLLRRYIIKPIQTLSAATTSIDNHQEHSVLVTSNDEIGTLQQNFNAMTEKIRQQTLHLEQQVAIATTARLEAERSEADLAAQLATIEEQRAVIREMSVPVLPVMAGTIVLPLIGALDSERLQLVKEQALQAIERTQVRNMILDITGVPVVDGLVAEGLVRIVQAARLLGASVMLVGIRPEVAQTLVGLGIDLGFVAIESSLQSGIVAVQRQR